MLVVTLLSFVSGNSTSSLANLYASNGAAVSNVVSTVSRSILPIAFYSGVLGCFILLALGIHLATALASTILVFVLALNPAIGGALTGAGCFVRAAICQSSASVVYALALTGILLFSVVTFEGVIWAWFGSNLIALGLGLFLIRGGGATADPPKIRMRSPAAIRRRGLRGLFSLHSPLESFRIDQLAVVAMSASTGLGLYTAALSLANLPKLLGQTLGTLVAVALSSRRRLRVLLAAALAPILAGVAMAALSGVAVDFLYGPEFRAAASLSFWLCLAGGFMGARKIVNEALRFHKRDGAASVSEIAASILFLVLVVSTYGFLGLNGIAMALCAAAFSSCAIGVATLIRIGKSSGEGMKN
ncbi:hypothetical protein [Arthrobacter sp. 754]|uniref:lipopolysaccharide biosynthesis protein n=1 Tax=Arthrobacter sp. 754 TaxID=3156315 RepID=UPI003394246A